jgi:hypothetical protein
MVSDGVGGYYCRAALGLLREGPGREPRDLGCYKIKQMNQTIIVNIVFTHYFSYFFHLIRVYV